MRVKTGNMLQPKVSVIIPVYNTGPYLRRCLDSVCNQTLRDIEIICVDDGSTDNSNDILWDYSSDDKRVKIINLKTNQGECVAKNNGINISSGKYIGFVDSDDYIDLDFFEKLHFAAKCTNAEIVKGNRIKIQETGWASNEFINDKVRENKRNFTYQHTTAIYLRDMLVKNGIYYPDGITNNGDVVFLIKAVCTAQEIETVDDANYYYMIRFDNVTQGGFANRRCLSILKSIELIVDYINGAKIPENDYNFIFRNQCGTLTGWRNREGGAETIDACAEVLFSIYGKCRQRDKYAETYPVLHGFWCAGDVGRLADYLRQNDSRAVLAANLRTKVLRKNHGILI
jgi:glycosyltransferase involved in cell wall biosynthesis